MVGHEFTHGVTAYSSQLFYAYQSGAINEAISDIMGELIDQSYAASGEDSRLWLIGEDLPLDLFTGLREIRDMANPNRLGQPTVVGGPFWSNLGPLDPFFDNGGVHTNSGPANYLAYQIANSIGVTKSAQLWYRAAHELPSGADYATLGRTLLSTCVQLAGHAGVVRNDCKQVELFANQVGAATSAPNAECGGGSTPDRIFFDDVEKRDKWTFSSDVWHYLPSPEVAVRYSASGANALYGYAGTTEPVSYATMNNAVTIPNNLNYGGPYFSFKIEDPSRSALPGSGLAVEYNSGSGWQSLGAVGGITAGDYRSVTFGLASLVNQSVTFRFKLSPTLLPTSAREWLIDDVGVVGCSYMYSPAHLVTAARTGTSADITWDYNSMPQDHIELTYDPPLAGAPTTLPGLGVDQSGVTRSVTVTGLDPNTSYTVSVVVVDDLNNVRSRPEYVTLATDLPLQCQSTPPSTFNFSWTPGKHRTTPGCVPAPAPPRK